uniref:maestro heat-like repeat-containing protein family member 1 n=1 Tax=Podarcis muralis TaxID=64176 RepID=UPI0010A08723
EVIREQPMASITNLHEAMENIIRLTALRPYMDPLTRSQLVQKITQKVFQLPSLQVMKIKAGSSVKATPSQDCYQETVYIWLNMLTSLLSEAPSLKTLQEILVHIKGWIDSTKISERQRAVKTTNALLKYVSEHLDFDVSQDFPLLGQLVALLSLHLTDNVKEIGLQSAEALYHLHYILIAKMGKELEKRGNKNKKGKMVRWVREDFFIPGPSLFHYNIAKVAKAFGEHLTPSQINEVVLKAIDNLTVEDRAVSQAAGKLLRSFLEECGIEMEN